MPASPPSKSQHRFPLLLGLILAGLAGNYFKFPLFLNIDFLFGSIFALLALQLFGLGRGIAAAATIAGYSYILWNHPYAIIILTAEAAVVGWLMKRRKMGMVAADTVYWLVVGMPLVYLFYHTIMQVPASNTYIVMTKQAVNGITNALAARLIFTAYTLRFRTSRISYRETIYNLLTFFVLCPTLIILAVSSRNDFNETDRAIRTGLQQRSLSLTNLIEVWIQNRTHVIVNLATLAATLNPKQMEARLEQARCSDRNFLRIGMRDTESTVTAYSPLIDEFGQPNTGKKFPERPYLAVIRRSLKPMLAEVVSGRIDTPKPAAILLAPVLKHGEYSGYINGVLNLKQIQEYLEKGSHHVSMRFTVTDRKGNIIITNRSDQQVMTPFARGNGTLNRLNSGISQWVPNLPANTPISEQWKESFYVVETPIGSSSEWTLLLEQPVAPFQKTLYTSYTGKLLLLFLILLGSMVIAEILSRRIIMTLDKLRIVSRDLPVRLAMNSSDTTTVWPESSIHETNHLINNFRVMADSLSEQFNSARRTNKRLERQAEELKQANELLLQSKTIAESAALAKSRFLNTVAHEFRTPLSLLTSSTDIIERYTERLSKENLAEQNGHIRSAVHQLSQLIDSVLVFNRLESVRSLHYPELLNIEQTCRSIAREANAACSSGQHFSIDADSTLGRSLLDKVLFRQVLENLLTNAFRYTPAQGSVSLQIRRQSDRLLLDISDTGIGIPEKDQEQIFAAFYRGSNVDARRGLGLGLSIVHESLRLMEGTIIMRSKAGEGTSMRVEIPLTDNLTNEE